MVTKALRAGDPVTLADAAPALFSMAADTPSQLTRRQVVDGGRPGHAGDIVVIYLTGLAGLPEPGVGIPAMRPPWCAASLKVTLNGRGNPMLIKYAGLTPGSSGLYQINLELPKETGNDPEIRVTAGNLVAQTGLKLPVR